MQGVTIQSAFLLFIVYSPFLLDSMQYVIFHKIGPTDVLQHQISKHSSCFWSIFPCVQV